MRACRSPPRAHAGVDMWITCDHVVRMSKMIQIRNVPDAVHRTLKARAAMAGLSLSEYLLREITLSAAAPSDEELWARLRGRTTVKTRVPAAQMVREERESH